MKSQGRDEPLALENGSYNPTESYSAESNLSILRHGSRGFSAGGGPPERVARPTRGFEQLAGLLGDDPNLNLRSFR